MWHSNGWRFLSSGILVMIVFFGSIGFNLYQVNGVDVHIIQLTDNEYDDGSPQIHNGQVTWSGYDGSDREIFLYDGYSVIQLTDNEYNDGSPQIHNGQVTWVGYDSNDQEIYLSKRGRAVIHYEPENTLIKSDGSNTIDILVVTPENSVILAPGESYILPDAMRVSSIPGAISEPPSSSSPEPETEPEQRGIPGFPINAIVIGVLLSLFILKKIQS